MVAELAALIVGLVALAAEVIHARRVRHVAELAFGTSRRPRWWARFAPLLRMLSLGSATWGLVTLMLIVPKVHRAESLDKEDLRHLVLMLDVSPSMRLPDAGPTKKEARLKRVAALMDSFFHRAREPFRISVVAVYNGAKPVVVDTIDREVVKNVLGDLPMNYAFEVGQTKLFEGLEEVAKIAQPWNPRSATLLILSDGDTVPTTGMPKLPASISQILIVGVGDPRTGSFIDGRQSRQDASTLRQMAARLGGYYHNVNEKQIPTDVLNIVTQELEEGPFERLTRREYALLASGLGALLFALLPLLLHRHGTAWRPGARRRRTSTRGGHALAAAEEPEIDTALVGSVR